MTFCASMCHLLKRSSPYKLNIIAYKPAQRQHKHIWLYYMHVDPRKMFNTEGCGDKLVYERRFERKRAERMCWHDVTGVRVFQVCNKRWIKQVMRRLLLSVRCLLCPHTPPPYPLLGVSTIHIYYPMLAYRRAELWGKGVSDKNNTRFILAIGFSV